MMKCPKCETRLFEKDIIETLSASANGIFFRKTGYLYRCPKCFTIVEVKI